MGSKLQSHDFSQHVHGCFSGTWIVIQTTVTAIQPLPPCAPETEITHSYSSLTYNRQHDLWGQTVQPGWTRSQWSLRFLEPSYLEPVSAETQVWFWFNWSSSMTKHSHTFLKGERGNVMFIFTWDTCSTAFTFTLNDLQMKHNRCLHTNCKSWLMVNIELLSRGYHKRLTDQTGRVWPPGTAAAWHRQRYSPADQWGRRSSAPPP